MFVLKMCYMFYIIVKFVLKMLLISGEIYKQHCFGEVHRSH